MSISSSRLLQLALPLVKFHGFTRDALANSVLVLPPSRAHAEPLPDETVSALFGTGDLARKVLVKAWLNDGFRHMRTAPSGATVKQILRTRLEYNEPVLDHLPEAFALLASPKYGLPPLDPFPCIKHTTAIANEACHIAGDKSLQLAWYARRVSLATIYSVSELHQLSSPKTAYAYLEHLLDGSDSFQISLGELGLFSSYIGNSLRGIVKSSGIS